jgi:hypothetical protein
MKTRDVYITKAETLTDTFVKTYPLNSLAMIQYLRLRIGATTGATSNTVGKLHHLISKIEVLDGSNVLFSCSGLETMAFNCFDNGFMPYQDISCGASVVTTEELILDFGRFHGDREYYLNTNMFKNPMLRITGAFAVSATVGIATGTGILSVIARSIEDGAMPYKGFIMRKEIFSWTSAASGDQPIILPLDYPFMGIMVAALKTTIVPDTILTNFKLSRNFDQYIDFNITGRDSFARNIEEQGYFRQRFRPLVDTAFTFLGDLYFQSGAFLTKPGATAKGLTTAVTAESVTGFSTTGGTADAVEAELEGGAPGASVYFPFYVVDPGAQADASDFLNPSGLGDLRLIATQGVTAAACTACVEQLHP